jgi:hypothetical protein
MPVLKGRGASSDSRRMWRTIFTICAAMAAMPMLATSALGQGTEYPAMEPPPDYVGELHERERATCAITGACDQPSRAPSRQMYVDKWTALAISDTTNRAGAAHGQNSQDEAESLALTNCRRNGSLDCKSLLWGVNTCLAIAISYPDKVYAWDNDANRARAGSKALARCVQAKGKNCAIQTTPCANDDPRWPSPLPLPPGVPGAAVDPRTVGTWELFINPGRWVWQIGRNGTYQFHSEAGDGASTHAGTFSARDGHWSIQATSGISDGGPYTFSTPNIFVTTGKLGTGSWRRIADN